MLDSNSSLLALEEDLEATIKELEYRMASSSKQALSVLDRIIKPAWANLSISLIKMNAMFHIRSMIRFLTLNRNNFKASAILQQAHGMGNSSFINAKFRNRLTKMDLHHPKCRLWEALFKLKARFSESAGCLSKT